MSKILLIALVAFALVALVQGQADTQRGTVGERAWRLARVNAARCVAHSLLSTLRRSHLCFSVCLLSSGQVAGGGQPGRDQQKAGLKHTAAVLKSLEVLNLGTDPISAQKIASLDGKQHTQHTTIASR